MDIQHKSFDLGRKSKVKESVHKAYSVQHSPKSSRLLSYSGHQEKLASINVTNFSK